VLVAPSRHQPYSAMVAGWVAGHFALNHVLIDLLPLCQAANVRLVLGRIIGMDAERRRVACSSGEQLDYDVMSLDVGSETDISWLQTMGDRLICVRPLDLFIARWQEVIREAQDKRGFRLIVVGGGASGVEVAFAASYAFAARGLDAQVHLVASEAGVLSDYAPSVATRVRRLAGRFGVCIHDEMAVGAAEGVLLSSGEQLRADWVIAATGARPPGWLGLSKMSLDKAGYVAVDAAHRSISHSQIFAAGDVCSREDVNLQRSGVHAVHAGAVLAHNVIAALTGEAMSVYRPRRRSLYLLSCGRRYAVASWGSFSAEGAWVWHWKRWIDERFIGALHG